MHYLNIYILHQQKYIIFFTIIIYTLYNNFHNKNKVINIYSFNLKCTFLIVFLTPLLVIFYKKYTFIYFKKYVYIYNYIYICIYIRYVCITCNWTERLLTRESVVVGSLRSELWLMEFPLFTPAPVRFVTALTNRSH